jgi:hypothetical protein
MTEINRFRRRPDVTTGQTAKTTPPSQLRSKKRHAGLFQAIRQLDSGMDLEARKQLAKWIGDQYAIEYGSFVLGMVAICYLGPPYVDHRLDLLGSIVEHYAPSDPMPHPYEGARMLARSGSYAFVEVHSNGELVPVFDDGTPS